MSDPITPLYQGFKCVDRAPDPELLAEVLRDTHEVAAMRELKEGTLAALAAPGAAVLDVGCGEGADVERLAALLAPGGRAVGVDPSRTFVEMAQAGRAGEFHVGDAEALPFADDAFDAARAERVLHYLADPQRAVGEMGRVVRPGGTVQICESGFGIGGREADDDAIELARRWSSGRAEGEGWLGHFVPLFMRRAGLVEVHSASERRRVSDPADALRALSLQAFVPAVSDERREAAERWIERFRADVAEGARWVTVEFWVWTGRVPATALRSH